MLEAALRLAQGPTQARAGVRFAFWGAEERGLIGSRHHVASLSEEMRRHIALYINLDMAPRPTSRALFRVPLRQVMDWLPWCDASSSLSFANTT